MTLVSLVGYYCGNSSSIALGCGASAFAVYQLYLCTSGCMWFFLLTQVEPPSLIVAMLLFCVGPARA